MSRESGRESDPSSQEEAGGEVWKQFEERIRDLGAEGEEGLAERYQELQYAIADQTNAEHRQLWEGVNYGDIPPDEEGWKKIDATRVEIDRLFEREQKLRDLASEKFGELIRIKE